jgi:hypothetical protein
LYVWLNAPVHPLGTPFQVFAQNMTMRQDIKICGRDRNKYDARDESKDQPHAKKTHHSS